MSTLDKVRQIASDVLGAPLNRIDATTGPEQIESWDSVQHLNIVMALEEECGVQFSPEDFDEMKNIGAIAALVDSKRG